MRLLGRTLFTALLAGVLLWHSSALWQPLSQYMRRLTGPRIEQIEAARSRLTYQLDRDTWTLFAIPAGATSLKISTNANLPTVLAADPEVTWHYAVAYELLDASGQVQGQRIYHHRSRVTHYAREHGHDTSLAAFYLDDAIKPANTRNLVIDLADFPSATQVRFRTASKHELLTDIAMSIYARTPVAERKLDYLWRRLPQEQKQSLAKGLAYSTEFLKRSEQHQLLQNRWQVLGPKGIQGRDYHARKLYILKPMEPVSSSDASPPSGLLVDAAHHGVIVLPPPGAASSGSIHLRLDFLPLSASHPTPDQHGIHLTWHGRSPREQLHQTITWQETGARFEHVFSPGLIELKVFEGATSVQLFYREGDQYTPWTVEPRQSRMYLVQPEHPVEFTVNHIQHVSTPFRIDVRHVSHSTGHVGDPAVVYEWLTDKGAAVQTRQLVSTGAISLYDRIPSLGLDVEVSDPSTSFFSIPNHVARIRLSLPPAHPPVTMLIAAWNRPPDLIRELHLGSSSEANVGDQRQWAWFPKRPEDAKDFVAEQRSYLLHVQPRPPQAQPALQAGDYQIEQYRPEGLWRGRFLFLPREPELPLRPEALAVTFRPLHPGRDQRFTLKGLPQLRYLQPKLIYFRKSAAPQTVEVFIDGARHHHGRLAGRQGEIALPSLTTGTHRIRLHSEAGTRWYMNHIVSGGPSYIKRLAYRFDTSELSFIYDRRGVSEETLSMRWYAPHGNPQSARIRVQFDLAPTARHTPSPSWTFNERRYIFTPLPGPSVPVLHAATRVDRGQAFFLPIGHDVPAGRYRIRLRLEQGPPGYVTLAKLTHGAFESRRFIGERVPQYVQTQP